MCISPITTATTSNSLLSLRLASGILIYVISNGIIGFAELQIVVQILEAAIAQQQQNQPTTHRSNGSRGSGGHRNDGGGGGGDTDSTRAGGRDNNSHRANSSIANERPRMTVEKSDYLIMSV